MPRQLPKSDLTRDDITRRFDYDPETGCFTALAHLDRRNHWYCRRHGKPAGWLKSDGYVVLTVAGRYYKAHRVAWLWAYGEWPEGEIDHKDGDRGNNRLSNLRLATASQSNWNRRGNLGKTLPKGVQGLTLRDGTPRFPVRIWHHGQAITVGTFGTPGEAQAAYDAAALKLRGPGAAARKPPVFRTPASTSAAPQHLRLTHFASERPISRPSHQACAQSQTTCVGPTR